MLTGCAVSDAMAKSALKSELNTIGKATTIGQKEVDITYKEGDSVKVPSTGNTEKSVKLSTAKVKAAIKALADTSNAAAVEGVKVADADADTVYYVREVPSSASSKSNWASVAKELNTKLSTEAYVKYTNNDKTKAEIVIDTEIVTKKITKTNGNKGDVDFVIVVAAKKVAG